MTTMSEAEKRHRAALNKPQPFDISDDAFSTLVSSFADTSSSSDCGSSSSDSGSCGGGD